jgi:hypothetical protein
MMEKSKYPFLMESVYALLMIIPQGRIFESLKNRVDVLNYVDIIENKAQKSYRPNLDFYIGKFTEVLKLLPQP